MLPRLTLLPLALAMSTAMAAQAPGEPSLQVYPVRVDHKIGYVKIYNELPEAYVDTLIPPRYDYIGDEYLPWNGDESGAASPYRLFELDERVGLLGSSLEEVLPSRYKRIRAVAPGWFAVEEDSLFTLIDTSGQAFFGAERYEDIRLADVFPEQGRAYFFVKQNQAWGLRSSSGPAPAAFPFAEIRRLESRACYKVRTAASKNGWQVVDTAGAWVLKQPFEDAMVLNPALLAARVEQHWQLLKKNRTGQYELEDKKHTRVEKINDTLAILVPVPEDKKPEEVQLWRTSPEPRRIATQPVARRAAKPVGEARQFELGRLAAFGVPWYFPLDERHILHNKIASATANVDVLLDYHGQEVSNNYEFIAPSGRPYVYKASRRGRWGLLMPGRAQELIIQCQYDTIHDFQGELAICRQGQRYGLLGLARERSYELPCYYESVSLLGGGRVRAQLEDFVVIFAYRPEEGFVEEEVLGQALLVSENTSFSIREAVPVQMPSAPHDQPLLLNGPPLKQWQSSAGKVFVGKIQELPGQGREKQWDTIWVAPMPLDKLPRQLQELDADRILSFHASDHPVSSPFLQSLLGQSAAQVRFYDLREQRFRESAPIIGYRPFDYRYAYTAYLAADGQMGLMDRQGQALALDGRPLRFTYIGPFRAGRARVCIGGQLVVDTQEELQEPVKFSLGSLTGFFQEFGVAAATYSAKHRKIEGDLYAVGTPEHPVRWGYLDAKGRLAFSTETDHVLDFHWQDSTAFFLRKNQRTLWGRPDADYGILDFHGREIAPAQYSEISNLEGYYLVSVDSTPTFYFTQKGVELFVNPTRLRPFSGGLAQFFDAESSRWGYLDTAGRVAIPPRFTQARPFSEGLALVADDAGRCVFIDTAGAVAFATDIPARGHQFIGDFRDGRCWFKASGRSWAWGAYRPDGQVAIAPQCYYQPKELAPLPPDVLNPLPMDFSRGAAAAVFLSEGGTPQYALIDTLGELLYPRHRFRHIGRMDELGMAVCTDFQGRQGLLDYRGELVVKPAYAAIEPFVNGFAKVKSMEGRWGLLSQHGGEALPPRYEEVGPAAEGLVAVKPFGQAGWSFVDTTNQMRLRGPYDEAGTFISGLAFLKRGGKPIVIDREGRNLSIGHGQLLFFSEGVFGIEEPGRGQYYADVGGNNLFGRYYREIKPFQLGVAAVRRLPLNPKRAELLGAINRRGVMVVPPKFRLLHIQPDGNIITNPQRFYGLLSKKGALLIPPEFDRIEQFEEAGLFRVERGEALGYMRIVQERGEWVWPLGK
jgi:hypothetical protein